MVMDVPTAYRFRVSPRGTSLQRTDVALETGRVGEHPP